MVNMVVNHKIDSISNRKVAVNNKHYNVTVNTLQGHTLKRK